VPLPLRPAVRRVIFLDVENTSRPQHLAHVIEHLALDYRDSAAELFAVANWKVVSQDAARLLAQRGAQLVHSAPSTGVRDWSDLRIAVAAGIWLAAARPGDSIEIVSDDRAFDAVGDVAASLGIAFHRLSYRQLVRDDVGEPARPERGPASEGESRARSRHRRGGRYRGGSRGQAAGRGPARPVEPARPPRPMPAPVEPGRPPRPMPAPVEPPAGSEAGEAHTAPHDALVSVVRELVEAAPGRSVSLDTLANALKSRGFRRPPGSPRLVTRLRRIREVLVSQSGAITLRDGADGHPPEDEPREGDEPGLAEPGNAALGTDQEQPAGSPAPGRRRRRRRRRGGRGGRRFPPQSAPVG
jgi:hypothetical protein